MFPYTTSSSDDDILVWIVSFNTDIKIIDLHASCNLAAFKQQVSLSYGLDHADTLRLEVKTEAGLLLDAESETLLASGAIPGEMITVTLLPQT